MFVYWKTNTLGYQPSAVNRNAAMRATSKMPKTPYELAKGPSQGGPGRSRCTHWRQTKPIPRVSGLKTRVGWKNKPNRSQLAPVGPHGRLRCTGSRQTNPIPAVSGPQIGIERKSKAKSKPIPQRTPSRPQAEGIGVIEKAIFVDGKCSASLGSSAGRSFPPAPKALS